MEGKKAVFTQEQTKMNLEKQRPIYVDEKITSKITGRSIPTLRNDRHLRRGLPYYKSGRLVRYELNEIYAWMAARKISF